MSSSRRTKTIRITLAVGAIILGTWTVVWAGQRASLLAYLPAVFDYRNGPANPTSTPTATPVPRHFDDCAFRTGNNATIAVTADVPIVGSFAFTVDDEIAVFNPAGTLCAGTTHWTGSNIAITAWGDDDQTDEVDGLLAGEEMQFRIWDRSANREIEITAITYSLGDGIYQADSIHAVSSFVIE